MKTLLAVPCMDMVAAPFAQSYASLDKVGECINAFIIGSLIYESRNDLAKQAIITESDYVMWFDSDMIIPRDTLTKMVKHMEDGKDIVTGLYFRRRNPYTPVLFEKLEIKDGKCVHEDLKTYPKGELFEVAGCGFGCVMLKTEVLADMCREYNTWFTPFEGLGEDLAFCLRARRMGYKIWCDPTISCGHVGQVIVNEKVYESTL